ncbi:hypothetical protein [Sphingobacterium sp.]|uniref:hypothetical protein n=1 Tax=Sphingobacterium sp. TaxID=341027 RepID=UPI0031D05555
MGKCLDQLFRKYVSFVSRTEATTSAAAYGCRAVGRLLDHHAQRRRTLLAIGSLGEAGNARTVFGNCLWADSVIHQLADPLSAATALPVACQPSGSDNLFPPLLPDSVYPHTDTADGL